MSTLARPFAGLAPTSSSSSPCSREDVGEVRADGVAEDDRVGDLHHRRLHVQGEEDAARLRVGDLAREERVERAPPHDGRVDDLAVLHRDAVLEHGHRAVRGDVLDAQLAGAPRPSSTAPSSGSRPSPIVATCVPRVLRPGAHGVRVLAREGLDGGGRAAVGVALAQHGVDRAALDRVVDLARVLVLRHVVAGVLELLDRRLQLRDRGRDVRQLDDVRVGRPRQLARARRARPAPCRTRRGSRPASEMSRSSISTPAFAAKASSTGSRECVARAGASSVYV